MAETTVPIPARQPRQLHFEWVPLAFIRPRHLLKQVSERTHGVWLAAILMLTITGLIHVVVAGAIRQAASGAELNLPPDFEYYSPDQQSQFMQAAQVTTGPVFVYVFPAILVVLKVWINWLVMGGLIHLALTLLGGRGNATRTMNIVAWGSLPFALRDVVRILAMLVSQRLIASPGISGFIGAEATGFSLLLKHFLTQIDIYLFWSVILIVIGVRADDSGLSAGRTWLSISLVVLIVLIAWTLIGFAGAQLGNMGTMRPFFY